jgi:hypothetical protein
MSTDGGAGRLGASDCERLRDGWLAQPVNAVTSLAYVVAGGVVGARAVRDGRVDRAALAYAACLGLVGLGSVAFHGPQPRGARLMHDAPVVGLVGLALGTPASRRLGGRPALPGWSPGRGALAAGLAALAAAAYASGRTGAPTCDPDSRVQLHGAWHVCSAAAFVVVGSVLHGSPGGSRRA